MLRLSIDDIIKKIQQKTIEECINDFGNKCGLYVFVEKNTDR